MSYMPVKRQIGVIVTLVLALVLFGIQNPAEAGKREKAVSVVNQAALMAQTFSSDDALTAFSQNAAKAKAVVMIPSSVRGGFVFGASGGNAAMMAKDDRGSWSSPSFMRVGSLSFGLQAGGDVSEIILLVMTNRGMEQLLSTNVKLGADLSIAAGPTGVGGKAQTTDVLAYSRSKGLFGSISIEGAVLKTHHKWNKAYYGRTLSPIDIVITRRASNPQAEPLRRAVARMTSKF